jgi:aspartyl-tRNA(Asn)/glutamyl-tRNA(Gln) amidotransferase subunit A
MRAVVSPTWGGAVVSPVVWDLLEAAAAELIRDCGLRRVEADTELPSLGAAWGASGALDIERQLAPFWPGCAGDLTHEVRRAMELNTGRYDATVWAKVEQRRMELNEAMAALFDPVTGVDLVISATNPDVAFAADGPLPKVFGGIEAGRGNNGRLTFPANIYGNPAISVPAGAVDGLPIGLQVMSRHFTEPLLLDQALAMERSRPWPLTVPPA